MSILARTLASVAGGSGGCALSVPVFTRFPPHAGAPGALFWAAGRRCLEDNGVLPLPTPHLHTPNSCVFYFIMIFFNLEKEPLRVGR